MIYHLLYGEQVAAYERVAYYFVYAFFVISGFSLYISYRDKLGSVDGIRTYALKRFLRIAPLFYFACALQTLLLYWPGWSILPLNLTLTFGFANPGSTSMIMGGWSIGIEMVFYVLLPFIVILTRGRLLLLGALTLGSIWLMVVFLNTVLAGYPTMEGVWPAYTQPVAFFGYFAFGCLVGEVYLRNHAVLKGRAFWPFILLLALVPLFVVHVETLTELLKGWTGLLLMSTTMAAITAAAFCAEPKGHLLFAARWLGRLSYSIYLLHPIVYKGIAAKPSTGRGRASLLQLWRP